MAVFLADVNVWLALIVAEHPHHKPAMKWLENAEDDEIVFCRVTQAGILRLLTNPAVMGKDAKNAQQAWEVLGTWIKILDAQFASEPKQIESGWRLQTRDHKTGANFWTDSYLAAFAAASDYTIVTFDRGFAQRKNVSVRLLT